MRYAIALAIALIFAFVAVKSPAAEPVQIPLKDIWAYRMPDTRNVLELRNGPLTYDIAKAISREHTQPATAQAGFVVIGSGADALRNANRVLVKDVEPAKTFNTDDELSIVFFSYRSSLYVHLADVQRDGNTIHINYNFVPHETRDLTEHFALIPLGKLPAGEYKVEIAPLPMSQKFKDQGAQPVKEETIGQIICKSFSFSVTTASKEGKQ